jgi:hypothetical protein
MAVFEDGEQPMARDEARLALLLLQVAAAQAEIGPFARRQRATPEAGARLYRTVSAMSAQRRVIG